MSPAGIRLAAAGLDLAIASAAPEAAARFYVDVLGAEPVPDAAPWRAERAVAFGDQVIGFRPAARAARSRSGGIYDALGLRVIGLRVGDLDAVCARFAAAGRRVADSVALPGQRPIRFAKDLDGCMLELIGAGADVAARPRLQVGLTVADAASSRDFYRDTLGFPERSPTPISKRITRYAFDVGGSTLKLWQPDPTPAVRPPEAEPGLQSILLRTGDLEAVQQHLSLPASTTALPVRPLSMSTDMASTLQDPDGNRIELLDFGNAAPAT